MHPCLVNGSSRPSSTTNLRCPLMASLFLLRDNLAASGECLYRLRCFARSSTRKVFLWRVNSQRKTQTRPRLEIKYWPSWLPKNTNQALAMTVAMEKAKEFHRRKHRKLLMIVKQQRPKRRKKERKNLQLQPLALNSKSQTAAKLSLRVSLSGLSLSVKGKLKKRIRPQRRRLRELPGIANSSTVAVMRMKRLTTPTWWVITSETTLAKLRTTYRPRRTSLMRGRRQTPKRKSRNSKPTSRRLPPLLP